MDALSFALWTTLAMLSALVLWRFSSVINRYLHVQEAALELQAEQVREKAARSAHMSAIGQLGGRPRKKPEPKEQGDDEDDDEDDDEESAMPAWLEATLVNGGVDLDRLQRGDRGELTKVRDLLDRALASLPQNGAAGAAGQLNIV